MHCNDVGTGQEQLEAVMSYKDIITIEPGKRGGKPCIRGMRVAVYDVLEYLASGMTREEILRIVFRCVQPIDLE